MPRLAINDTQKRLDEMRRLISYYMDKREVNDAYMAAKLGINPRTFRDKRKRSPETFSYGQILVIMNILRMNKEDKEALL